MSPLPKRKKKKNNVPFSLFLSCIFFSMTLIFSKINFGYIHSCLEKHLEESNRCVWPTLSIPHTALFSNLWDYEARGVKYGHGKIHRACEQHEAFFSFLG